MGLGSVILVLGAVVAYVAATFNPNDYKSAIIQAVKEKTGRTLELKGDIGLSLFPSLGMKLGPTSLSERNSAQAFAGLESAFVSVKVMPLLAKDLIVDAVELKGLRATIVRDKAGKLNVDDLVGAQKPEDKAGAPVKIDIARVEIADADVTFADQAGGMRYRLSKLDLKTGRIANGVTTPVDLSAVIASEKDKAELDTKLKAKLTFDLERQLYKLDGLDFSVKGRYGDVSGLNATAKGNVEARLGSGEYVANPLEVAVSGKRPGGDVNVKLDAPRLALTQDKVEGGKAVLEAQLSEPGTKLTAKITVGSVQGAYKALSAGPLDADIEMKSDGRTVKARLGGALTGNLETKRFELPNLALAAKVSDPKLPKGSFDADIKGAARADLTKESAGLDFTGKLEESSVSGKVAVAKFSPLAVTFDLNADQLDVDRLMGKAPGGKSADAKTGKGGGSDDRIDLSALKTLNAAGSVRIGKLTAMNLKSSQFRADMKVAGGRLDVSPVSAQLYQGTLNGSLSAQAANQPVFTVKQSLAGVAVGPLLRDAANIDTLDGKGTVNLDLITQGVTMDALKKALNGNAAIHLADGSLKGIDIAGTIRSARDKIRELRGEQVKPADKTQKTDFSELKATFNVKNGVARNNDLSMKSPLLRVSGAGDIDIGHDRMNYVLKATLVGTTKGQGGKAAADLGGLTVPVKLTGPINSPQYAIDFAGMVTDVAKQRVQDELLKRLPGQAPGKSAPADGKASAGGDVKDAIKDRLKGILGR
jgi:AsmA protein